MWQTQAPSTSATMSNQHGRMLQVKRFSRQSRMLLMLPFLTTMLNEISSFRQSLNKLNMFNLFRLCQRDEISLDIVARTATMSKQHSTLFERTKFYDKLVRHCCRFRQQRRMLLRQSRTLLRHSCWCRWRFRVCVRCNLVCRPS